jgi:hypothetical protein
MPGSAMTITLVFSGILYHYTNTNILFSLTRNPAHLVKSEDGTKNAKYTKEGVRAD